MTLQRLTFCHLLTICAVFFLSPPLVRATEPQRLPVAAPADVSMDADHLARMVPLIQEAIGRGDLPGCVVTIGRQGKIVWREAYGDRQIEPVRIPMTVDTVFDMASLTKPIATATSVMMLVERGQIRLSDAVSRYLPEFGKNGKEDVSVQDLLVHQGGLIPDNRLSDYDDGLEKAWERICDLELTCPPGTKFIYTDVGYIVLGKLVERISGEALDQFARSHIFEPLGMSDTGYLPTPLLARRAAPTEQRNGHWMRGEVHDPRAYLLGGVAGHAGLFSSVDDLAVYCQMMLNQGSFRDRSILSPRTVAVMTKGYPVSSGRRGLGWDMGTGYSSNRGELMSSSAFGHGGFTGTAMWIDPELDLFVIFLSNRLHPDGKGTVNRLAGRIGSIAVASIRPNDTKQPAQPHTPPPAEHQRNATIPVETGIDVLGRTEFEVLRGRRVGLITNHTGVDRQWRRTLDVLHEAKNVELVALFSPEHGLQGKLDQANIGDAREPTTQLPVFSLYGETRRPKAEHLKGIDTLVFDIQDIGTRFYTYISTMHYCMEAAAEHGLRFVVLDRPNPIGGLDVAGPVLDAGKESFVACHRLPVRHGMTVGELARMFNTEDDIHADLVVVKVSGWRRSDYFDQTGLGWINPSPNMRSLTEAILYPGIGLLETTNLSVGRGTDTPFEVIGAPWLDGVALAERLRRARLEGVTFVPVRFTPTASKYAGEPCGGINIAITDRRRFRPIDTGLEIARQLHELYPEQWDVDAMIRLLGNQKTLEALKQGQTVDEIHAFNRAELDKFLARRAKYLLYK